MKKLILPVVICGALTLFSFTKPTVGGVQKVGEDLYTIEKGTAFSSADTQEVKTTLQKAYNISDMDLKNSSSTGGVVLKVMSGKSFVDKYFTELIVYTKVYIWDRSSGMSAADLATSQRLSAITAKYVK